MATLQNEIYHIISESYIYIITIGPKIKRLKI